MIGYTCSSLELLNNLPVTETIKFDGGNIVFQCILRDDQELLEK